MKNKHEWLEDNFYKLDKIPKGFFNIIMQPRKPKFKLFNYKGVNERASQIFECLLFYQGFITRGQMEEIIKDMKEGKLK